MFILFAFLFSSTARATLGEHQSKIDANESVKLSVRSHKVVTSVNYSVHELLIDGTLVKEFADASGKVFAVSWRGIKIPNFEVLFGSYFSEFKSARENVTPVRGHRAVSVKTDSLVFHQAGSSRNLSGMIFVPSLVPKNVNMQGIQ